MLVDDRLATVLNIAVDGDVARRIQYRQLLDLIGTSAADTRSDQHDAAHVRLSELAGLIPHEERAKAIGSSGIRLRNPRLLAELAADHPVVALAAIKAARLDEGEWLDLIPAIPLAARGLLRVRRDLGPVLEARLEQLGINDRALPASDESIATAGAAGLPSEPAALPSPPETPRPRLAVAAPGQLAGEMAAGQMQGEGIAAIVRRIETFRRNRELAAASPAVADSPRLPLGETEASGSPVAAFSFATDAAGRIGWADAGAAPMVCGLLLPGTAPEPGAPQAPGGELARAFRRHLPLQGLSLRLEGAPAIAGEWIVDASPDFDDNGRFAGYLGRLRRPPPPLAAHSTRESDRIRQVLHELRTPVNAIQGFAEVIQQQLFGATPHEYRALAASIAADAAHMLAGFEELDRFARLDAGALAPEPGRTDISMVVAGVVHQLEAFTGTRGSGFSLSAPAGELAIAIDPAEAERLVWRLLATLAGVSRPGEILILTLDRIDDQVRLLCDLPESLAGADDIFAPSPPQAAQAVNSGVFGNGFTLRLAAAEAHRAGGLLERRAGTLLLALPFASSHSANAGLQNHDNTVASAAE